MSKVRDVVRDGVFDGKVEELKKYIAEIAPPDTALLLLCQQARAALIRTIDEITRDNIKRIKRGVSESEDREDVLSECEDPLSSNAVAKCFIAFGNTCGTGGDLNNAQKCYLKALEISEKDLEKEWLDDDSKGSAHAMAARCAVRVGITYEKQRNLGLAQTYFHKAIGAYNEVCRIDDDIYNKDQLVATKLKLAGIYRKLGMWEDSAKTYEACIDSDKITNLGKTLAESDLPLQLHRGAGVASAGAGGRAAGAGGPVHEGHHVRRELKRQRTGSKGGEGMSSGM